VLPTHLPKKLPIDLARIETHKGGWLVAVEKIAETEAGDNLLLKIILEQSIDEEHFRTRELGMKISAYEARNPDRLPHILSRIRDWIESTEGDGFIEIADQSK
jgi:hypothetical protein